MKRILVFSESDWFAPYAGAETYYLRNILERLASQGHYAAVVAHQCPKKPHLVPWLPFTPKRPTLEIANGVQIARLGARPIYPFLRRMLLSRLAKAGKLDSQYDLILHVVTDKWVDFSPYTHLPVLPVVFALKGKTRVRPDGPVIAATHEAEAQLARAGFLANQIITAPFGIDSVDCNEPMDSKPAIALAVRRTGPFICALEQLEKARPALTAYFATNAQTGRGMRQLQSTQTTVFPLSCASTEPGTPSFDASCRRAWFGVCGPGLEYYALRFTGAGRPALCPDTPAAREYIIPDETGLLYPYGDARALAGLMERLLNNEVLYKRLCMGARRFAEERTWEHTAALLLGTIENMT